MLDLSGAALKRQSSTMAVGGPQPRYGQPAGQQTTVSIDIPPPAEFARGLTEMLTSILVKTGRFVVLERAAMQQIDQEQAIGAAGKTTRESAAKSGGLLGAQALVTGDITGFAFARLVARRQAHQPREGPDGGGRARQRRGDRRPAPHRRDHR
ncbi:MAG: hypothetical protein IPF47_01605 [Gemmatimonadetes bacterium]|nr:hypothetical protein [Gemmatimonadota bacterium]